MASNYLMKATADALIALADGNANAAAHLWRESAARSFAEGVCEPLRAAAHNNVGIAYLIEADPRAAADQLALAAQFWCRSRARIDAMDVTIAGRSSVFHLRLAMQHQDAFCALRRRRYVELCEGARAISAWNARLARGAAAAGAGALDADESFVGVLAAAFGPECPEARLVREANAIGADAISAAYRSKAERLAGGAGRSYLHGEGLAAEVECAALATALLHPSLVEMPAGIR